MEKEEAFAFVEWVGSIYIRANKVWLPRYSSQLEKKDWKTTAELYKMFQERKDFMKLKSDPITEEEFKKEFLQEPRPTTFCTTQDEYLNCPNMEETYSDMDGESYKCKKKGCNQNYKLYYDEMR